MDIDKAAYGLMGIVLGIFLTVVKEWWFQSRKNQKEIEYLSIQIACTLDRFIAGCVEVVQDDGLFQGQYGSDGCCHIQTTLPKFEPESVEVEWKSLSANIMYEILNFPSEVEASNSRISNAFEYAAFPPDYDEGFEERQYQYSLLGIKAFMLASKLRKISKLPERATGDWNPIEYMNDQKLRIEALRKRRAEKYTENMEK